MSSAISDDTEKQLTDEELRKELEGLDFGSLGYTKLNDINQKGDKKSSGQPAIKPAALAPSQFKTNLERFRFLCKDMPSPDLFIDCNFHFLISACLARKLWLVEGDENEGDFGIFPNLYMMFIARPGIGKSAPASVVNKLLDDLVDRKLRQDGKFEEFKLLNLGPDAITFEKLVLRAAASTDSVKMPTGGYYHHSSTTFCLDGEVTNLFHAEAHRVISFLNQSFDCRKFEGDTIKHNVIKIKNICVNFLACCPPKTIKGLVARGLLDDGFAGRTLMIFGDKKRPHPPLFKFGQDEKTEVAHLVKHLRKLAKIPATRAKLSDEARKWLSDWHYNRGNSRINSDSRLDDYYSRKKIQLIKFALGKMVSEPVDGELRFQITVEDFEWAESLLLRIEPDMHKALGGGAENKLANIAEEITTYLGKTGVVSIKQLTLKFYSLGTVAELTEVFEFLVSSGQCQRTTLDGGKPAIKLVKQQMREEVE